MLAPEELLAKIPQDAAETIVHEWRAAKKSERAVIPSLKTIQTYSNNARMLETKYSNDNNVEVGILTPVDIIERLFAHAASLSPNTWRLYRASFVYTMNARALEAEAAGRPQPTLMRALATLIVLGSRSQPTGASKILPRQPAAGKSIRAADFDKIITHLATAYAEQNLWARRAQSFAMATISTGMRPTEWINAKLRPALADEVPIGFAPTGWLALEVDTAKRKSDEPAWKRTIIVEPGIYTIHIEQHYDEIKAHLSQGEDEFKRAKYYSMRCSLALGRACQELWPDKIGGKAPIRIRLYSLRHQARANVAAAYGGFVAAAMMGHSPAIGANFYAGKHRANGPRSVPRKVLHSGIPVPVPGKDVLDKAAEFAANPAQMQRTSVADEFEE